MSQPDVPPDGASEEELPEDDRHATEQGSRIAGDGDRLQAWGYLGA